MRLLSINSDRPHNFLKRSSVQILILVVISLLLRFIWLTTSIERDEGSGGYVALLWSKGSLPYVYSLDNKGLLHYAFYLVANFFGDPIIAIRLVNNISFAISVIGILLLSKNWFDQKVGIASALFYGVFMNVPVLEGIHAKSDSFVQPFMIFSIYVYYEFYKTRKKWMLLVSSILMSLAFLINIRMIVGFVPLLIMMGMYEETARNWLSSFLLSIIGALIPITVASAYLIGHGAFNAMIEVLFFRSVGIFIVDRLTIPFGPKFFVIVEALPLWIFAALGIVFSATEIQRKEIALFAWLSTFLGVTFLISPLFIHRFLPMVAPASIFAGVGLISMLDKSSYRKIRPQIVTITIILLVTSIPSILLQTMQYPDYSYDLHLWWRGADLDTFEQQIELSHYLKSHTSENGQIFVHGWAPEIYWLSEHVAPSLYAWSIGEQNIPDKAYQELLNLTKQSAFEHIVLMQPYANDPINTAILAGMYGYYYVKNIGHARIYTNEVEIVKEKIIVNDNQTGFWMSGATGKGQISFPILYNDMENVMVGSDCLEIEVGPGSYQYPVISHHYDVLQDWSEYDFIEFWWFGQNSGKRIEITLWTPDIENRATFSINEDWFGWEQIVVPLEDFAVSKGMSDLAQVGLMQIWFGDNTQSVWNLDQVRLVDVPDGLVIDRFPDNPSP